MTGGGGASGVGAPTHRRVPVLRRLGGLALLGVGIVHLQQDLGAYYSAIPTIGTLFVLNFAAATPLALALQAPVERLPGRAGRFAPALLAWAGIALAAATLLGLVVSEQSGLFGFREVGYRGAVVLAIALELATIALLGADRLLARARLGGEADPDDVRRRSLRRQRAEPHRQPAGSPRRQLSAEELR
jgi:hypothetical protein